MPSPLIDDMNDQIRALLRRKAEKARLPEAQLRHMFVRSNRRLARNAVVALLSVALAGYGIAAGVRSLEGSARPRPANRHTPAPSALGSVTWVRVPGVLRNLPLGLAGSEGAVWVVTGGNIEFPPPGSASGPDAQAAMLSKVDPVTGEVTGTVEVGKAGDVRVVAAFGDAWVLRPALDLVIRFDGTSLAPVGTISVSDPVAGVSDGSSVWLVSGGTGTVSRIDPGTNHVVDTIETGVDGKVTEVDQNGNFIPPYNGTPVVGIATFEGSVWVHGRSQLVRIDATSGAVLATMNLDGRIGGLAAGDAGVWISLCTPADGPPCSWELARVDPGTNTLAQTIPLGDWKTDQDPGSDGSTARVDLVIEGAEVWASLAINYSDWAKGKIVEIDPATAQVVLSTPVDGGNGTNDIQNTSDIYGPPLVQGGAVWVINIENDEVVRQALEP